MSSGFFCILRCVTQLPLEVGYLKVISLILIVTLSSCKDYYHDMRVWSASIAPGTSLQDVKRAQPNYIDVAWNTPDTLQENILRYHITNIRGHNDPLHMSYFLEFKGERFRGQFAHK